MNEETGQAVEARVEYEYYFATTPRYLVVGNDLPAGEKWDLCDVFLKYLDNGAFVFVPVFRRKILK